MPASPPIAHRKASPLVSSEGRVRPRKTISRPSPEDDGEVSSGVSSLSATSPDYSVPRRSGEPSPVSASTFSSRQRMRKTRTRSASFEENGEMSSMSSYSSAIYLTPSRSGESYPVSPFSALSTTTPSTSTSSSTQQRDGTRGVITPRRLQPAGITDNENAKATTARSRTVYLIRHGESKGQAAPSRRVRQTDPSLTDCGLTTLGRQQARSIKSLFPTQQAYEAVDWVISSPLTRCLETAVLAFPDHPILCHYDLREIGNTNIPENVPRSTKDVMSDIVNALAKANGDDDDNSNSPPDTNLIDLHSLRPESWPRHHDTPPKVVRQDRIRQVFAWLARELPDPVRDIAVVCHYHVIRTLLSDPHNVSQANFVRRHLHPENAQLYSCALSDDGTLTLLSAPQDEKFLDDYSRASSHSN